MKHFDPDRLVEDHKNLVYHLIARFIPETSARDEVFQEVFLNVFRSLPTFKGESKLSTWIASVAIHTCYTQLRKIIRGRRTTSLDQWLESEGETALPTRPDDDRLKRDDARRMLMDHIDRLPPKYKAPIWLFYFEGLRYEDIAEALNVPMGTVKIHLFRGLKKLRTSLEGEPS
jgi:RNA polymerase sigma factor (sigma-70 family)